MARLYMDEDILDPRLAEKLKEKGHDVLTAKEAGNINKGQSDNYQLNYATENERTIITNNRRHFNREHLDSSGHKGIISGNHDKNIDRFAGQVDAVVKNNNLENVNIRANANDFVVENKAGEKKTYTYDQPKIDPNHTQQHQPQTSQSEPTSAKLDQPSPQNNRPEIQAPPEQAPTRKSLSDFRRGDDQANRQQKQEVEKRPAERLIDQYRRPTHEHERSR